MANVRVVDSVRAPSSSRARVVTAFNWVRDCRYRPEKGVVRRNSRTPSAKGPSFELEPRLAGTVGSTLNLGP